MRSKIIFSLLAILIFLGGTFFAWKDRVSVVNQTPTTYHREIPQLVEAPKETPSIGYDAWKESHAERTQLAGYYSKDTNGAYWYHMKIIGADPNTFDVYNDQYAHDQSNVFYQGYNVENNNGLYTILGADVATFQAFEDGYAKDKNFAYFRGVVITGADAETFVSLGPVDVPYAKDKKAVYRKNEKLEGFDPITFRVVDKSSRRAVYLADSQKVSLEVWFSDDQVGAEEITGADSATFEVVKGWWTKDKNKVFYRTQALEKADPQTFVALGEWEGEYIDNLVYAKDKEKVYFLSSSIPDADATTFQQVENVQLLYGSYGQDKNNAYRGAELFPKNDLAYFQKGLLPLSAKNLGSHYYLYQGKAYYYFSGGHAPSFLSEVYVHSSPAQTVYADASSFKVIKDKYARDDENVYFENHLLTHDPNRSFVVMPYPYSRDEHTVYYEDKRVDLADPLSFTLIPNSNYSKDKNFVYYSNYSDVKNIKANLLTFEVLPGAGGEYGKDASRVFYRGQEVTDADPHSFKVIGKGLSSDLGYGNAPEYYSYAKDSVSVFCEGSKLADADPETFTLKGKNGMPQDKNHHYDGCEIKE